MTETKGKHREPRRKLPKILGVSFLWWTFAAGVAVAAFIVSIAITGSISTGQFDVFSTTSGTSTISGTCTVTQSGGNSFDVQWTGAFGGDTCVIALGHEAAATNDGDAALQSVALTTGTGTDDEVTAAFGTDCGFALIPGGTGAPQLTLTIDSTNANPGETYTLTGSDIQWVPAGSYNAGACT